jgi:hypothetical protein
MAWKAFCISNGTCYWPDKHIWILSTFNGLFMPAHQPASSARMLGTWCIQHPHKSNKAWLPTFVSHPFVQNSSSTFCLACISHMSQVTHFKMASCWTLSKHPQCSHICIHVHQATPHKDIKPQALWQSCSWTSLPSSSVLKPAHALSHLDKSECIRTHSF